MKHIILLCALLCTTAASADDYKILSMSKPTLTVDGRKVKVGDVVSDKSIVQWDDDAQTVRLYNLKTRRQAVMTAVKTADRGRKLHELLSSNRHLSTKGVGKDIETAAVERVKTYCTLMEGISGNVDKIEDMDKLYAICENNNVSVINDLSTVQTKKLGDNSMPLQQYMMMLTSKYDNNVKTHHSGYKYLRTVFQPSPIGLDGVSYAQVKVDKSIDLSGVRQKSNLHITVNTATMKVSSTTSADYESPQEIFYDALDLYNQGDMSGALEKFERVMSVERFPGRYRARTMAGWIYADRQEYRHAHELLRESSAADPLGGVLLASRILMRDDVPFNLRNYTEGMNILQRIGETKDTDFPQMHLIAKAAIFDALFNFKSLGQTVSMNQDIDEMQKAFLTDPATSAQFLCRGYILQAIEKSSKKDYAGALQSCQEIQSIIEKSDFGSDDEERFYMWMFSLRSSVYQQQGNQEMLLKSAQELMEKPYGASYLALGLMYDKTNDEQKKMALNLFRQSAEAGDALGAYIMSLSYMPLHDPLKVYEELLIRETMQSRDSRIWKGWDLFIMKMMLDENIRTYERDAAEFRRWNQIAIDRGSVDAMEDRALLSVLQDELLGLDSNIPQAVEMVCNAACLGMSSDDNKFIRTCVYAISRENEAGKAFEESETFKTLKRLDEEGNGAASYILYCSYYVYVKDSLKGRYYLERSKDAKFAMGMADYAGELVKTDPDKAFSLYEELTVYAKSHAYHSMGEIEEKNRKNYQKAMEYYKQCYKVDYYWKSCEAISDLYRQGLGTDVNLEKAKSWISLAASMRKLHKINDVDDEEYNRLVRKEAEVDNLIARGGAAVAVSSPITRLNGLLDASVSEDDRITQSELLLTELFASPKAVVKTVGSNGTTVVATETAEDFMLSVATMQAGKKLSVIDSKKDEKGKFTELTVKIE